MKDCIIIGGGLIGMLTARALRKRGLTVTVLDRGPFGREASWAGGGILSPLYPWRYVDAVNQLAFASQRLYPSIMEEIKNKSGVDPEWKYSGLLALDVEDISKAESWAQRYGIKAQTVTAEEIREWQPLLSLNADANFWMPRVAQVRNPKFIEAMETYLQREGVTLIPDSEVANIESSANHVTGVTTVDGRQYTAGCVVIANGAWSGRLLKKMQVEIEITPVRGQMILLQAKPGLIKSIVLEDGHYLIQRADGKIIVGSTVENVGFDKSTTIEAHGALKEFAEQLLPELKHAPVIKHWAGLRPGCGSGIPFICGHPDIEGLYINAGHYRNGIVMAPASAELLAVQLCGEQYSVDPEPYSLRQDRGQIAI